MGGPEKVGAEQGSEAGHPPLTLLMFTSVISRPRRLPFLATILCEFENNIQFVVG